MLLKDASILIVDDEPILREIFSGWIEGITREVFCAENGAKALEVMAAHKIDLIITDLRMPVMDGITLLKRVKKSGSHTPSVIFISGFSDIETRNAYDLGAEAFLEKPIAREDLIHSVQRSLAERKELWQTPLDPDSFPVLTGSFESVAAALHECKLAFGRGGFCIRTEQSLREGRVNIRLNFKTDAFVVSGQGIVRWVAPQEHLAGIEIVYLSEESRAGVLRLMEPSISFIPGTTGRVYQVQTA